MAQLTAEQKAQQAKRNTRNAKIANAGDQAAPRATDAPVSFQSAVAAGEPVGVNALELEIAPFVLSNIPKGARLMLACPEILVTHAVANKDDESFDVARTAEAINRGRQEADFVTADAVAQTIGSVGSRMDEEEAAAMLDLVHLAVKRRQHDLTREQLDESLDIPGFLILLRAILRENPNLADPS